MGTEVYTLVDLLEEHELTQKELAELVGVSPGAVSVWVNRGRIGVVYMEIINDLFNLQPGAIHIDVSNRRYKGKGGYSRIAHSEEARRNMHVPRTEEQCKRIQRGILLAGTRTK